ncbi:putative ABC1 protein At2g40090 isoform X2 [Asparagus officinalis]|uniref:putative ABC1 protein At2g40090 isoform X2 n=1 Tax=Asparagus officinalis TaxID=4686 RepID=UPI00098E21D7|nr:putative ABC1 protein At2g40090 isoform X2 [Asparagus officinalis]
MWRYRLNKLAAGVGIGIGAGVGIGIGGAAASSIAATSSDDPPTTSLKILTILPLRLLRDSLTAAAIALDYEYSMWGFQEGTIEWSKAKHQVHSRCARRIQELCFRNGGIYIKLGQYISQLDYIVPQEYIQIMRASLLKRCPVSSYDQVRQVFIMELGSPPEEIFKEFDPVPLASASIAQVHAARTHDGKRVAVKVQHVHLTDTAATDIATVDLIVNFLHWCFPAFDYRWLVDEIRESAPKELDFLYEARNSEKCLENFRRLSPQIADAIYAPKIYWDLSTSKLLTMEFMDAAEISDVSQAFAEMIFRHGFVHCDPHAANMMVRPLPSRKGNIFGRKKPQLILLDHGLYKDLDFQTRTNYAALWKALVFADVKAIKEYSVKLGAGEDLYVLFAGILTMRPWNRIINPSVDHLVLEGSNDNRSELQMYASQYFPQISELLRRLPRVILLLLKTNDCLRAVSHTLLKGPCVETFLITARVSSEVAAESKNLEQKRAILSGLSRLWERMLLEARFFRMRMALWVLQFRKALSG